MMSKQHFYIIHADADQMQVKVEGPGLKEYLSMLSRRTAALNFLDKSLTSVKGDTTLYYPFKYGSYTNKGNSSSMVMFVHGNKGTHRLSRKTDYRSIFLGDKKDIVGVKFFDYVFGTEYPSETLLRTGSEEEIIAQVQEQVEAAENASAAPTQLKDKDLICHILAKLHDSQLANPACRFVILLPAEKIAVRSGELIKQLYAIIPPTLRAEFGFATNVTPEDIQSLITPETAGGCDLPIHVFTMAKTEESGYPDMIGSYPVVYFDTDNYLREEINPESLDMVRKWVAFLGNTFETKMAYVERLVLGKHSGASFSNLKPEVEKITSPDTFFWQGEAPKNISELASACESQKELLDDPLLKAEVDAKWLTEWFGALSGEIVQSIYKGTQQHELSVLEQAFNLSKVYDAIDSNNKSVYKDGADSQAEKDKADIEAAESNLSEEKAAHDADIKRYSQELESQRNENQKELEYQKEQCQQEIKENTAKYEDKIHEWERYADELEASNKRKLEQLVAAYEKELEQLDNDWKERTVKMQAAVDNAERIKQEALDDQKTRYDAELKTIESGFGREREDLKKQIVQLQNAIDGGSDGTGSLIRQLRSEKRSIEEEKESLSLELDKQRKNLKNCVEEQQGLQREIVSLQGELEEKNKVYQQFRKKHNDMVCSFNLELLIKPLLVLCAGVLIGFIVSPKASTADIKMNGPEEATYSWQMQDGEAEPVEVQADEKGVLTVNTEVGKKDRSYSCEVSVPEKIIEAPVVVEPIQEEKVDLTTDFPYIEGGADAYCIEIRPGASTIPVNLSIGNGEKDVAYRLQKQTERGWSDVMGGSGKVVTFTPSGNEEEVYRCIVIP